MNDDKKQMNTRALEFYIHILTVEAKLIMSASIACINKQYTTTHINFLLAINGC